MAYNPYILKDNRFKG